MTIWNYRSVTLYWILTVCVSIMIVYLSGCTRPSLIDGLTKPDSSKTALGDASNALISSTDAGSPGSDFSAGNESPPDRRTPIDDAAIGNEATVAGGDAKTLAEAGEDIDGLSGDTNCPDEGALRCVARDSAERQVCLGGLWIDADPCDGDKVCDYSNSDSPGTCISTAPPCLGTTERYICSGDAMHYCNVNAISESQEQCKSRDHCRVGLEVQKCAQCLPGEDYVCDGSVLKICSDEGTDYETYVTCISADECNAVVGACIEVEACSVDDDCSATEVCQKAVCSDGKCITEVDEGSSCGDGDKGVCDLSGDCVECIADSHCDSPIPFCEPDKNVCVECLENSDCYDDEVCASNQCTYVSSCGNGILESDEQCDDGNHFDFDGCGADCQFKSCDPDWACAIPDTDYCYCSNDEVCLWNRLEGSESRWGCVLMCERDSDCPDFGYPRSTVCMNKVCLFPCESDRDCPDGTKCRTAEIDGTIYVACGF